MCSGRFEFNEYYQNGSIGGGHSDQLVILGPRERTYNKGEKDDRKYNDCKAFLVWDVELK